MRRFTELYFEIDSTNRTSRKLDALVRYFRDAPAEDAAWALAVFSGGKPIRAISSRRLRDWVVAETQYPEWLIAECYDAAGDLAEALALLLPPGESSASLPLHEFIRDRLLPLPQFDERRQHELVRRTWRELTARERFIYHKMITGSLRVGVAARLVTRALAEAAGLDPAVIAHRLSGHWFPSAENFRALLQSSHPDTDAARPYPFALAYPLESPVATLGPVEDWQAEYKWDGIRSQVIKRGGEALVWSRGNELVSEAFPEVRQVGGALPDGTVVDGEILAWEDDRPLPFAMLQRRINRKHEAPRLWDEVPIIFMAFDLLEADSTDIRAQPLSQRRRRLEQVAAGLAPVHLRLSPIVRAGSWEELAQMQAQSREHGAEGLMLKRLSSGYGVGRQRGDWWKWKVDPFTIDAVLIYAQYGNGKRASVFTDYTFGVWDGPELVPVAKAYSGLTDAEIREVDAFVRRNTLERFGPVRAVRPELVFELAFQGVQLSTRHRSGVAVRFPRIARWRRDKIATEADTLDRLRALLPERVAQVSNLWRTG